MEAKVENKRAGRKGGKWWVAVISLCVPLIAAVTVMSTYGGVRDYVSANKESPFEYGNSLKELLKENYVLYKNLQEKLTGSSKRYSDLYILDIEKLFDAKSIGPDSAEEKFNEAMKEVVENNNVRYFGICDYYIEDLRTGISISNTLTGNINKEDYYYYLEIVYDENGFANVVNAQSTDTERLMKNAAENLLIKNKLLEEYLEESTYPFFGDSSRFDILQYGKSPENCRIIYGITQSDWEQLVQGEVFYLSDGYRNIYYTQNMFGLYTASGIGRCLQLAGVIVFLLALLLPLQKLAGESFSLHKICRMPLEVLVVFSCCLMSFLTGFVEETARLLEGVSAAGMKSFLAISRQTADDLAFLQHGFFLYLLFLAAWYLGMCARPLLGKGFRRYIREYSLTYRVFPFCKRQFIRLEDAWEHIDLSKKAGKKILSMVLVNGLAAFLLVFLPGNLILPLIYCALLYLFLRIYVSRIQKKYRLLLSGIQEISRGNLNVDLKEDLGIFNPLKEELLKIQGGFKAAVEAEIKSQRMKSELITNVSHDLKTPLTAITTYVDLMKEPNATEEQKQEYLEILERKSERLKVLIEDLFEISKATSGSMNLKYVEVDICSLIKQVRLEMADKLEAASLDIRMELPTERVTVLLDSQKTYRIFENLFLNIAKYALKGTRVYVQGKTENGHIAVCLKNISASEISMDVSELAERFVRGDASRNTEGSGLGLAIAKSLTELQGGTFRLESDGDLFKVFLFFPCLG